MTKGGKRLGAGRPKTFTPTQLLALANEVTLLMKTGLSASKALKQLQRDGYIKPQTRDRYLGRKYFDTELMSALKEQEAPRTGIAQVLPRLSKNDPI